MLNAKCIMLNDFVGNAVLSVPSAKRNLIAENFPIEVKFSDGTLGTAFPTAINVGI